MKIKTFQEYIKYSFELAMLPDEIKEVSKLKTLITKVKLWIGGKK